MAFKFEKLEIWKKAFELGNEIHDVVKNFPPDEQFNLSSQLRRAADSVALNIAEGCTGQTDPEQRRFLGYSLRSAIEVVSCLFFAKSRKYLPGERFQHLYDQYEILIKMITRFRDSL